eukprot:XP_028349121.1 protein naked cuticle homolog 2 [Physeter catodon]
MVAHVYGNAENPVRLREPRGTVGRCKMGRCQHQKPHSLKPGPDGPAQNRGVRRTLDTLRGRLPRVLVAGRRLPPTPPAWLRPSGRRARAPGAGALRAAAARGAAGAAVKGRARGRALRGSRRRPPPLPAGLAGVSCPPRCPVSRASAHGAAGDSAHGAAGDSVVVSAYPGGRSGTEEAERRGCVEHGTRDKQELPGGDPKEGPFRDDPCPLEVALPPEQAEGPRGPGKRRLNMDALQCDVSVEEDNRQEWTCPLYGLDHSGRAAREDTSSPTHAIYEAVDASVNRSSGGSKTLRVKLTLSPEPSSKRKEGPPAGQDREPARCRMEGELPEDPRVAGKRLCTHIRRPAADPHPCSERGPYRVDENTERRNHYLDLAGSENYASKFGPGSPPARARQEPPAWATHPQGRSRSQESDAPAVHHRRCLGPAEPGPRALDLPPRPKGPERPFLRSPQGSGRPPGAPGGGRPGRAFSFHPPAPQPQAPPQDGHHVPQPLPPPYGHRWCRQRGREGHSPLKAAPGQPAALEHEAARELPPALLGEAYAVPAVQRHEHPHPPA